MIRSEGIHHVSLSVTDLKKAKQFYGSVLGFKEIERPKFDFPGAWYQIGPQQLHLIVDEGSSTLRKVNDLNSREGHFAVRVKDYEETLEHLKEQRVQILEKPKSKSGFAQIFCMDPDFNLIEFNVDQETMNK
ncbi:MULTISPECIES: VOC family protein [Bacillaceae]|uniref:VOC family protein n=1 Tax=Bacillaceae TaxID=186817 RepID=UPI000BFCD3D8|nr:MULTISPECIES: VOC family protein [Bacillaceae]PGT90174.1 glyoxalase [Bacillus sp. AFS040349]UGB32249.1 VOC family protein [Metabacillus sp. B2-18]